MDYYPKQGDIVYIAIGTYYALSTKGYICICYGNGNGFVSGDVLEEYKTVTRYEVEYAK